MTIDATGRFPEIRCFQCSRTREMDEAERMQVRKILGRFTELPPAKFSGFGGFHCKGKVRQLHLELRAS